MRMLRHTKKNEHHEDWGCGERHRYEEDKGGAGFRLHPEDNMFLDGFEHCARIQALRAATYFSYGN